MAVSAGKSIQRIDLPTRREFFERWLPLGQPLVIAGAFPNWRAMREWSIPWFKENHGETMIWVESGDLFSFRREHIALAEFITRAIEADPPERLYWSGARLLNTIPGLADYFDLDRPDLFSQALMSPPMIYVGPDGAFSPIHYDDALNFSAQVVGTKRWVFYAPDQTDLLYRYPWHHVLGHFSEINTVQKLADYRTFPLFERAESWEAIVEPGDLIHVPRGWWHHVISQGPTISLHFFWKRWPQYLQQLIRRPLWRALGKRPQSDVWLDWRKTRPIRRLRAMLGHDDSRQIRELNEIRDRARGIITGKDDRAVEARGGDSP